MSVGSSEVAELFFTNWTNLADTPSTITALQFVRGNASGTALEFVAQSAIDHGGLGGLTDDDHTQYILVTGARAYTGGQTFADATDAINSGAYSLQMDSGVADGAAAVAYTYDTVNALPTDGVKMCSWLANGVEQAWMTADGAMVLGSTHIGTFHETQIGPSPIVVNTSPEQDQLTIFKRPTDQSGVRRAIQAAFEYDQAIDRTSPSFGINCFVSYDGAGGNSNGNLCCAGGRYGLRLGANFNTGTINRASGINVQNQALSGAAGTITEAIGLRCETQITSGSATTDFQTVRGIWIENQGEGSIRNQAMWVEDNGPDGGDITFGQSENAQMYYNLTDFVIDPDIVGTGRVLIGATGDDDLTAAEIVNNGGRIKNTTRVTGTYTILVTDSVILGNTDGGAFTATLPVGAQGQDLRVINSGSSANNLTLAPDGSEDLLGVNSSFTLADGEALQLTYDATDGWY